MTTPRPRRRATQSLSFSLFSPASSFRPSSLSLLSPAALSTRPLLSTLAMPPRRKLSSTEICDRLYAIDQSIVHAIAEIKDWMGIEDGDNSELLPKIYSRCDEALLTAMQAINDLSNSIKEVTVKHVESLHDFQSRMTVLRQSIAIMLTNAQPPLICTKEVLRIHSEYTRLLKARRRANAVLAYLEKEVNRETYSQQIKESNETSNEPHASVNAEIDLPDRIGWDDDLEIPGESNDDSPPPFTSYRSPFSTVNEDTEAAISSTTNDFQTHNYPNYKEEFTHQIRPAMLLFTRKLFSLQTPLHIFNSKAIEEPGVSWWTSRFTTASNTKLAETIHQHITTSYLSNNDETEISVSAYQFIRMLWECLCEAMTVFQRDNDLSNLMMQSIRDCCGLYIAISPLYWKHVNTQSTQRTRIIFRSDCQYLIQNLTRMQSAWIVQANQINSAKTSPEVSASQLSSTFLVDLTKKILELVKT